MVVKFEKSVTPLRYSVKNRSMDSFIIGWKPLGFEFGDVWFMLLVEIKARDVELSEFEIEATRFGRRLIDRVQGRVKP